MATILYIEDDQTNLQLVQFIFSRREDLDLIEAETGSAGIQMAIQHQPDMILLDLSLPDIDGFNVFKQLQNHDATSHIPVIALSGNNTEEDVQKGMDAGLQGYLSKPISVVELYAVIDKTISSA